MKKAFWLLWGLLMPILAVAQHGSLSNYPLQTKDTLAQEKWVDSLYNDMSLKEKVGQLFMVGIQSRQSKKETDYIKTLIKNHHIGGVIFSKGGPGRQAQLTNAYQDLSETPLLIGQDAEWGLAMRLDSTYAFPWNMTLGAIENSDLIRQTGKQIGRHAKRLGININFAPDVDININPDNPIIGNRSFGEDRENVAKKGLAFVKGMESQGVLASIKHFPGHGDTEIDSHKALPVLDFTKNRLDSIEFYPYKKIIPKGVSSVVVGHLEVPALDARPGRPATLSKPIVTGVLKNELAYNGLIVTDALNMKGVANYENPGQTSLDAFLAGNDLLLMPRGVKEGINRIVEAYKESVIEEKRLEYSVKKILRAKYKVGLNEYSPVKTNHLKQDLNGGENDLLYSKLMENAITVIKNDKATLPLKDLDKKKIAYVPLGNAKGDAFYKRLQKYDKVDKVEATRLNQLMEKLKDYDFVIVGFHKSNANPWQSYKFTEQELVKLNEIAANYPTVLNVFASPYALLDLRTTNNLNGIIIGYQNSKIAQEKTAEVLFGAIGAKGKLPVSLGKQFPAGTRYKTKPKHRLSYGIPESVGMDSKKLKKIDSMARHAIAKKMTPGMQILVARKGKVIYQKSFGYQTYNKTRSVRDDDIYDLASMTKILATLPLLMELEEKGSVQPETKFKDILPFLENTNKANITLKQALSHYGRFKAWIPFYKHTMKGNTPIPKFYSKTRDSVFNIKVAEDFYMKGKYRQTIYDAIANSGLRVQKEYKYSDLPFYLLKKYLEGYYGNNLDYLTRTHFYKSMGTNHLGYLPLERFDKSKIVPSEKDNYWRQQTLRGYVNDQGAAMFGGIGGEAGLFGNANDVAKMMQMYLNGGQYGGKRYFDQKTINTFNTCYFCDQDVRRGMGFDKPQSKGEPGPTFEGISKKSFGHTGFTGTIGWADPEEDIIYVLLSNRTFPHASNRAFITNDIRTKIQKLIYQAIESPVKKNY